jgi:hypothetical protein
VNPQRIQRRRTKGWHKPEGVVNCTRPSDWSNPFKVGSRLTADGTNVALTITPTFAVALFAAYVEQRGWMEQMTRELRGRDLMCYCAEHVEGESFHCHVDWILSVVNA